MWWCRSCQYRKPLGWHISWCLTPSTSNSTRDSRDHVNHLVPLIASRGSISLLLTHVTDRATDLGWSFTGMHVFIDILKLAQHVYNKRTATLCWRTHSAVLHVSNVCRERILRARFIWKEAFSGIRQKRPGVQILLSGWNDSTNWMMLNSDWLRRP